MAEWMNATVLKTVDPKRFVGSNPTPSATTRAKRGIPAGKPTLGMPEFIPYRACDGLTTAGCTILRLGNPKPVTAPFCQKTGQTTPVPPGRAR